SGCLTAWPFLRLRLSPCCPARAALQRASTSCLRCSLSRRRLLSFAALSLSSDQPIMRTPFPSGCFFIRSSNVTTLPPAVITFLAAFSDIEKAQTVSLCPRSPVPRTLPGITTTSSDLVISASLRTLISRLFALGPASSSSRARQIGALFFLKAWRRVQIVLSTIVLANIRDVNSYQKIPK